MISQDDSLLSPEAVQRIRLGIRHKLARRRRGRRATAIVGAGVMAAAATAGGLAVRQASERDLNTSFECHTSTDPNVIFGTSSFVDGDLADFANRTTAERVAFAVATCTAGFEAVPTSGGEPGPAVPNPTGCLLPDGRVAVYPNAEFLGTEEFCSSLSLAAP